MRPAPRRDLADAARDLGVAPLTPPPIHPPPPQREIDPEMPAQDRVDLMMRYVWAGAADAVVGASAYRIVGAAVARGAARRGDPIAYVQALVDWQNRAVPYADDGFYADGFPKDVYQSPGATIARGLKDCEDGAMLLCAQCWWLGLYAEPNWISQEASRYAHAASRVCLPPGALPPPPDYRVPVLRPRNAGVCAGELVWVETTLPDVVVAGRLVPGARVGEHPYAALARQQQGTTSRSGIDLGAGGAALCASRDANCPEVAPSVRPAPGPSGVWWLAGLA